MPGEIWTYNAINPNDNLMKKRPILIIGNDSDNGLQYVDIHYVIISSSSKCGIYDIKIEEDEAKLLGLQGSSIIKTTKIYTGSKSMLGNKISDLPIKLKNEFMEKYKNYQTNLIDKFVINDLVYEN